jgi:hypothetical protein
MSIHDSVPMFLVSFVLSAIVFFGGAIGGVVAGGWLGTKWISPWFVALSERKRQQTIRANPGRPADQPLDSNAHIETRLGGLTIDLPAMGVRRAGGCFLLLWCIAWNCFVLFFSAFFIPQAFAGNVEWNGGPEKVSPWFAVLFISPFWAIGLGLLLFLMHRGYRWARLTMEEGQLSLHERTLFGSQVRSWPISQITAVGTELDKNVQPPRRKIVLHLVNDQPATILRYRPPDEIAWLAGEIRRSLERSGDAQLIEKSMPGPALQSSSGAE